MIRLIMLVCCTSIAIGAVHGQSQEAVLDKIENSYAWLNAQFLKNSTTLNLTEEQWAYALKNEFVGLDVINNLGSSMVNYFEILMDNKIANCRYAKGDVDCEEKIEKLKSKIHIEANLASMKMSPARFKLAMYALNTIGGFIGNNNIYGVKAGWRQKGETLKIILNIDNGVGQPQVKWNPEGTVATVTMFVGEEVGDWSDNMLKGLTKGGTVQK